ncbi:MAG TPA: hypothetical protein VFB79_16630 [Candidatus Angelobacter sp.]|nr:hypothetical protein [Candidatus Angelobacter sp.]
MSRSRFLTNQQKAELSEDTQTLLQAGFINNDLTPTHMAFNALMEYFVEQNRVVMVTLAKEKLAQVKN